jgi:hypothetical protein
VVAVDVDNKWIFFIRHFDVDIAHSRQKFHKQNWIFFNFMCQCADGFNWIENIILKQCVFISMKE